MLWTIFVVLLSLWILGFSLHVNGILIHLLLVIALTVLIINVRDGHRHGFKKALRIPGYALPSVAALRDDGISDALGRQQLIQTGDDHDV